MSSTHRSMKSSISLVFPLCRDKHSSTCQTEKRENLPSCEHSQCSAGWTQYRHVVGILPQRASIQIHNQTPLSAQESFRSAHRQPHRPLRTSTGRQRDVQRLRVLHNPSILHLHFSLWTGQSTEATLPRNPQL